MEEYSRSGGLHIKHRDQLLGVVTPLFDGIADI